MTEEEKKEVKKEKYVVQNIATQTKPVIVNTEEKDPEKAVFEIEELLAKMANDIEVIKKGLLS